ncbi:protein tweety isoform X4 [Folsomia candida]|uniref:protein tweety isoform X4 n=1 Tax=Folsomia candida TaxID=158441 RepID=UPI001604CB6F|nr:protein tweety isoform X4 [Folsomia candida]
MMMNSGGMSSSNSGLGKVYPQGLPPWLARFFHRFPHVNVTGHRVNSTFDWRNEVYVESLGILACLPALLLIFFLLILLLYLLTRCCDRHAKRDRPLICLKVLLGFLALTCCAAIGLGLYGNDDFHNGIESFVSSLRNIQAYFDFVKNQTLEAQSSISEGVFPLMSQLGVVFERPLPNNTIHVELLAQMTYMEQNMTSTLDNARTLARYFDELIQVSPHSTTQLIETIRWPTTLALLIIFIIFCVILFYAIVRHSRCCFITFSVLGLIAVILNWCLVSFYLASAVALADICVNPTRAAVTELSIGRSISPEISSYYLDCEPKMLDLLEDPMHELVQPVHSLNKPIYGKTDTFDNSVLDSQTALAGAQHTLRVINSITSEVYPSGDVDTIIDGLFRELYNVEAYLQEIAARGECQPTHLHWKKGVEGVCGTSLFGLALLLVSGLATALLFTLLVGFDSHTWIYIQRRKRYLQKEEIAFLPSSYDGGHSHAHGHGTGSTGRGGRRSGGTGMGQCHRGDITGGKAPWVTPSLDQTMASTRL